MHWQIDSQNRTHKPDNTPDAHWRQQKLRVVQEMQRAVAQEGDDGPIAEGEEIEGVPEKGRDEVGAGEEGHEEELKDVEDGPEGEEGTDGDLFKGRGTN
ncbi:MAG: hypothetical protein Q9227_006859 [Pyrenula ochraceoflavens]